jgi:uncharacterized protein (UPF0264 family)
MSGMLCNRLLVSVRSVAEAEAALAGGAALLDIKEPRRGPLGAADLSVLQAILKQVAGRRPVSAALGELPEQPHPPVFPGLQWVKYGLAGWQRRPWRQHLDWLRQHWRAEWPRLVLAAYADWQQAQAPPVAQVVDYLLHLPGACLLLDTFGKQALRPGQAPPTLLHWLSLDQLAAWCQQCRQAGVSLALAGSLGPSELMTLRAVQPDWLGVRRAACTGGRWGQISAARVRELVQLLHTPLEPSCEN